MRKLIKILFALTVLILLTACKSTDIPPSTDSTPETSFPPETKKEAEATMAYDPPETEDTAEMPNEKTADEILSEMSIEEKVGQLFLARNPKTAPQGKELIETYHVGGIIFFGRDFKNSTPSEFKKLIDSYNKTSGIPLLTSVDEEGGTVTRASLYKAFRAEKFASPAELYKLGGLEKILSDAAEKSDFLLDLGLNFNLAPVADISTDENDFIFERSLGLGKEETAQYVSLVVKLMNQKGILSALKHFPGYGNNKDTHTGIAYDKRSFESIMENDLVPFAAGIEAGAPVIMVSHNIVESIDSNMPASLSGDVIKILRDELGFEGVIMTDDLSMDAIKDFTESGEAAVLAILAGTDLLCCSDIETQYQAVLEAVKSGRISAERIEESVLRILNIKLCYKIIK